MQSNQFCYSGGCRQWWRPSALSFRWPRPHSSSFNLVHMSGNAKRHIYVGNRQSAAAKITATITTTVTVTNTNCSCTISNELMCHHWWGAEIKYEIAWEVSERTRTAGWKWCYYGWRFRAAGRCVVERYLYWDWAPCCL